MKKTILNKIIFDKNNWIQKRKIQQPLLSFKDKINTHTRDFDAALKIKAPAFILECKKHSPSLGTIKKDFNIFDIAQTYKKYAAVISVLTDEKYFHGNLNFINKIRGHVSQPILCKDFFIDTYQIYLARYYHADAILLMLSILTNDQYIELSKTAKNMNMGVLTEINTREELERAVQLNASVIGINNRNLHDLSLDFNRTRYLAPLIPKKIIIISESGIKKYSHIQELSKIVHGFLIGSSLMSHNNLDIGVRSLIFGQNKICGLTRFIDSKVASTCGAVFGGLIFVKDSPRYITLKIANNIIINQDLQYVGVFKNENIKNVVHVSQALSLHAIQLHGDEDQEYINKLRMLLSEKIDIWKVFSINSKIPLLNWKYVNRYLFDSMFGGSNKTFDWSLLSGQTLDNVILAGGININNCLLASELKCSGLDLNSGIEVSPGIKNHKIIRLIFHKLRYYK